MKFLVGIDEVGRGPIAGPLAVGAFAVRDFEHKQLLNFFPRSEVKDSKKMSSESREIVFSLIKKKKKLVRCFLPFVLWVRIQLIEKVFLIQ